MRNPGRTGKFFLISLLIGVLLIGGIVLGEGVTAAKLRLWGTISPLVVIDLDQVNLIELEGGTPFMTLEDMGRLQELPHVKRVDFSIHGRLQSFDYRPANNFDFLLLNSEEGLYEFLFRGVSAVDFPLLREGVIEIIDGRPFTQAEIDGVGMGLPVIMVPESLALRNNWKVGDHLTFDNTVHEIWRDGEWLHPINNMRHREEHVVIRQIVEFEIAGIFATRPIDTGFIEIDGFQEMFTTNEILIPNGTLYPLIKFNQEHFFQLEHPEPLEGSWEYDWLGRQLMSFPPVITLYSSVEMEAFMEAAADLLPVNYTIHHTADFAEMLELLSFLAWFSDTLLLGSILGSSVLLALVTFLYLKERRQEVGIYLALGEGKLKIITQFLGEIWLSLLAGSTLALGIGYHLADVISETWIRDELLQLERNSPENFSEVLHVFRTGRTSLEEMEAAFEITLGMGSVATFYLWLFATGTLAALLALSYVFVFKPKKILL